MKLLTCRFASLSLCFLSLAYSTLYAQSSKLQRVQANAAEVPVAAGEKPLRLSLVDLMKAYHISGMSIAIVENYKIVEAKGYGVIEAGSNTRVTTHTLYQAGSISKPVAATGALSLVEKGKLSLDEDVNQELKTWKVPENEFTKTQKSRCGESCRTQPGLLCMDSQDTTWTILSRRWCRC
jgi:CubicO group peptidase (beta-lactamase class C family)